MKRLEESRPSVRLGTKGETTGRGDVSGREPRGAGAEDRLRLQGGAHRRLRGGQVAAARALRPQRVQPRLQGHHRGRVPDAHPQHRQAYRQGADLGHRWTGEVGNQSIK